MDLRSDAGAGLWDCCNSVRGSFYVLKSIIVLFSNAFLCGEQVRGNHSDDHSRMSLSRHAADMWICINVKKEEEACFQLFLMHIAVGESVRLV